MSLSSSVLTWQINSIIFSIKISTNINNMFFILCDCRQFCCSAWFCIFGKESHPLCGTEEFGKQLLHIVHQSIYAWFLRCIWSTCVSWNHIIFSCNSEDLPEKRKYYTQYTVLEHSSVKGLYPHGLCLHNSVKLKATVTACTKSSIPLRCFFQALTICYFKHAHLF